ncbi:MAG TPA: DUF5004 domain-containing protein [Flavisolibacter sp.]|nr:DUF5004 domain-containing protein [Flavisolibacter sp.]
MLKRISTSSLGLLSLFIISSCTKDSTINDAEDISGTWQVTGIRSDVAADWDGDGYTETDIYADYSSCQRDIVLHFEPDGRGESRQGCNASWQSLYWTLTNNNRNLSISLPGDDLDLRVVSFSRSQIRGEDQVYFNGRNYVITYTLSRR